jgi:cytoskeletal protein CcmA (bactofilin family)
MPDGSVIGPSSVVRGNVRGEGNLEILGRVEGDVSVTGDIVLGESAGVRGSLSGASITVAGQVQGDIRGSEAVLVEGGAKIIGDLLAPRIGVAAGALVKGNVRTEGEAPLGAGRRPVTQGLRSPSFAQKPVPAPAAAPAKAVEAPRAAPSEPEASEKPAAKKAEGERQAPPPVVPALAKGAKAKKKKQRE